MSMEDRIITNSILSLCQMKDSSKLPSHLPKSMPYLGAITMGYRKCRPRLTPGELAQTPAGGLHHTDGHNN